MRFTQPIYLATVFLTGASVLITEISAIRLLSIQFGTSMDVVSGVLAIILLSLSCGYYVGGKLSDRYPTPRALYLIICISGALLLLLSSLAHVILHPAVALEATHPLLLTFGLFFLPAFLMGMDSPYVIKLLTQGISADVHGAIVGKVFFWSTVGSILGSLATGFLLLPNLGVKMTLYGTSVLLILLGAVGYTVFTYRASQSFKKRTGLFGLLFLLFSLLLAASTELTYRQFSEAYGVIHEEDGLYSHILIAERERDGRIVRTLEREVNSSSAIYPGSSDIVFDYLKPLPFQIELQGAAQTVLQIGGGAYSGPKAMHERFPHIEIDVAEIEPALFPLAQQYFELPETPQIRNHVVDGRQFLQRNPKTYDVIYLDAFQSGHFIPPHLVSEEFFSLIRDRLTTDGLLIINFIGIPDQKNHESLTGSLLKTLNSVFPNISVYLPTTWAEPSDTQNILIHARTQTNLPTTFTTQYAEEAWAAPAQVTTLETLIHPSDTIFTDDLSRVELLVAREQW